MKLAILSARIHMRRQLAQEVHVPFASRELRRQDSWVHACDDGPDSGIDHLASQCGGVSPPNGKQRFESGRSQLLLAVGADVFQKEIAKGDCLDAFRDCPGADARHSPLILLVGAWPRQGGGPQWETRGGGCFSSRVRRTACMATRSKASLIVVNRPVT